jgi:uncharacterized membrane protein YqaE (UPF0057 family)
MKKILLRSLLTVAAFCIVASSFAFTSVSPVLPKTANTWAAQYKDAPELKSLTPEMVQMSIDKFLSLTPSKYKQLTGQKLGLKKSIELKAAQKFLKKNRAVGEKISKGLYIVLAIFGLGWVALGVLSDWTGNDWWVNLLLTLLCYLPGLIHALVKMKDYYK